MKFFSTVLLLAFTCLLNQAQAASPVLVELFTSQSCSSCPEADKLMARLAAEENIIALSCHVTYWDHLDWKDTLSLEDCTNRQRDFGRKFDGGKIYTPEAIVNGRVGLVGHNEKLLRSEIARSGILLPLMITRQSENFSIVFPALPDRQSKPYLATLMAYGAAQSVAIKSGENRGENIAYTNPVIYIEKLEPWDGKSETRHISLSAMPKMAKGFVIVIQEDAGAPVIALGEYKFSN